MTKFFLLLLFPLSLFAQPFQRCNTSEYYKQFRQDHPEIVQQENQAYESVNEWLTNNPNRPPMVPGVQSAVTIPVVFHIVFSSAADSISDQVIMSQLDVMNKDYSRMNTDSGQTPLVFRLDAGNPQIQFCLAQRTPANQWTNGIERRKTTAAPFASADDVKFYNTGGLDAWDTKKYLNIWVCDLGPSILGIGTMPYGLGGTVYDGVVINFSAFGTIGSLLKPQYNKGRTATHEIGHWLGMYHIWGDDVGCVGNDSITDTPNQGDHTYGCPNYPKTNDACSPGFPGIMFMNYMDYTDDACMNMFSYDQALKMNAVLNVVRPSLLSSAGCTAVGIEEANLNDAIQIYPNPAREQFTVSSLQSTVGATMELRNMLGELVYSSKSENGNAQLQTVVDVSRFTPGIYQLILRTKNGVASKKISVVR